MTNIDREAAYLTALLGLVTGVVFSSLVYRIYGVPESQVGPVLTGAILGTALLAFAGVTVAFIEIEAKH